jgi:hypothetical protein
VLAPEQVGELLAQDRPLPLEHEVREDERGLATAYGDRIRAADAHRSEQLDS